MNTYKENCDCNNIASKLDNCLDCNVCKFELEIEDISYLIEVTTCPIDCSKDSFKITPINCNTGQSHSFERIEEEAFKFINANPDTYKMFCNCV